MADFGRVYHEFGPIFDKNSKILILGSIPSVKSREEQFYYGHPRNRFWQLLARICKSDVPNTVEEKKKFVLKYNIALWDVIESCDIEGSSDSSIKNVKVNDINIILNSCDIKKIYINGGTAYDLYNKYLLPKCNVEAVKLPSTSPANAAWNIDRLYDSWKCIAEYMDEKFSFEAVYRIVRMIPEGKVATYGQIALMLGNIRWARMVGYALHANPDGDYTPCYRVVNKEGKVSDAFVFGGKNRQIELLQNDGIEVVDGYVDMKKYQWEK